MALLIVSTDLEEILPFWGGGECPVQYFVTYDGREYYVRYRHGWLSVDVDHNEVLERHIGADLDGFLSDEETTVYLWEISRSIRLDSLFELVLPTLFEAQSHPLYVKGPLPLHPVGLTCGLKEGPASTPGTPVNRHTARRRRKQGIHVHTNDCLTYVPAQGVAEWLGDHPEHGLAFRECFPAMWAAYVSSQESVVDDTNVRSWPGTAT